MANSKAQQYEIVKNSELCLNKFDADIVQFGNGFNKKNSPVLGGAISNMFFNTSKEPVDNYDSNGKHEIWTTTVGGLYVDGKPAGINKTQRKFVDNVVEDKDYIEYANSSNYIYRNGNNVYCVIDGADPVVIANYNIGRPEVRLIQYTTDKFFAVTIVRGSRIETDKYKVDITFYGITLQDRDTLVGINGKISNNTVTTYMKTVNDKIIIKAGVESGNTFITITPTDSENFVYMEHVFEVHQFVLCKPSNSNLFYAVYIYTYIDQYTNKNYMVNTTYYGTSIFYLYKWRDDGNTREKVKISIPTITGPTDNIIYFVEPTTPDILNDGVFYDNRRVYIYDSNYLGLRYLKEKYYDRVSYSQIICMDQVSGSKIYNYYYSYSDNGTTKYGLFGSFKKFHAKYRKLPILPGEDSEFEADYYFVLPTFNKRITLPNGFNVLLDANNLPQSFSYSDHVVDNLGILVLPFGIVNNKESYFASSDGVSYYNSYDNKWHVISIEDGLEIKLFDKYVLFNTTDRINAYDIEEQKDAIWANDWNNRIEINRTENVNKNPFIIKLEVKGYPFNYASAFNYSKARLGIPSSFLPNTPIILYKENDDFPTDKPEENKELFDTIFNGFWQPQMLNPLYDLDVYIDDTYYLSMNNTRGTKYTDVLYDGLWDNISWYTPAITMKFTETYANVNTVSFSDIIYRLSLSGNDENRNILLYDIDSQYRNIEEFFTIQGQNYFIQNNKIYKYDLIDNEFANQTFVKDITGIEYLCNSSICAFFWSKIDSSIYSFTADNVLSKIYYTTDISTIYDAEYYSSIDMIVMLTDYGLVFSRDTTGMFILNDVNSGSLFLHKEGYVVHYDNDRVTYWSLRPVDKYWNKKDIEFSTKYYGLGSNLISISDTWYLRLFADKDEYEDYEYPRIGNIILSVDALTDKGMSTEEKTIPVKESDWDKLTNTLYVRFQPKLQRAVGISLSVKSPFAIGYIGVSSIPETTQMSKPSLQV